MKLRSRYSTLVLAACLSMLFAPVARAIQVTFQVDLSVQIALGNFNPGTDSVFISGTMSSPTWQATANSVATNFVLAVSGTNANVYVGIFDIVTTPGNWADYKFLLNGNNTYTCLNKASWSARS